MENSQRLSAGGGYVYPCPIGGRGTCSRLADAAGLGWRSAPGSNSSCRWPPGFVSPYYSLARTCTCAAQKMNLPLLLVLFSHICTAVSRAREGEVDVVYGVVL